MNFRGSILKKESTFFKTHYKKIVNKKQINKIVYDILKFPRNWAFLLDSNDVQV